MNNEWIDFINVLYDRGRRFGYRDSTEKTSEKLTYQEQAQISGYLLKRAAFAEALQAISFGGISDETSDHMINMDDLTQLGKLGNVITLNVINYFYVLVDNMLKERSSEFEYIPPTPLSERIVYLGE